MLSTQLYSQSSGWDSVATILARISPPIFPNIEFNITASEYGAVGDGITDCTSAINKAIKDCSASGGGKVVVPSGTFLTGAIYLESNVNLFLSKGSTLLFSKDKSKYLPVVYTRNGGIECMNYSSFIYAFEEVNIAISGSGTLDGQADNSNWWNWISLGSNDSNLLIYYGSSSTPVKERIFGDKHFLRPSFIQLYRCKNILIDSITIKRSPMWEIHPVLSQNITVSNVSVNCPDGPNNDRCNPESCSDVLIKNCYFNTGDDCIAIKSGKNNDGRRVNVPSQNIVITNCRMADGHGGITFGSEMTGGIRNVYADNCSMIGSNLNTMIRFKINSARGGVIENIYVKDCTEIMDKIGTIHVDMFYNNEIGNYPPTIKNIFLHNISSNGSPYAIYIKDGTNFPVRNIQLTDCNFNNITKSPYYILGNAQEVILENVKINGSIITKVDDVEVVENEFRLSQNYPNPFNPETVIGYQLPVGSFVSLKIYDSLGKEIAILVNKFQNAGIYNSKFSIIHYQLSSGIYYYRIVAGSFVQTKKLVLLK